MSCRRVIVFAFVVAVAASRVDAQATSPPAGRLEVSVGAGWIGGSSFGQEPADLRAASGGPYRLFESDTQLGGTGSFEARVGYALTVKVALTAYMRKILTILNGIMKHKTPWQCELQQT